MSGSRTGKWLGLAAAIAVAGCEAARCAYAGEPSWWRLRVPWSPLDTFLVIAIAGALPAIAFGGYLGWFIEKVPASTGMRFTLVAVQAIGCVLWLGVLADWLALVPYACAPVVAACWQLERSTRPPEPVPVALLR